MQSLPLVLKQCIQEVKQLYQHPPQQWLLDKASQDDVSMMKQQSQSDSTFDTLALRSSLWRQLEEGTATLRCKTCENAKVVYLQTKREEPPWDLWGRILQWLGPPPSGGKWRIFWFPARTKRQYPRGGQEVGPSSLNGGYSYPCTRDMIVIYRLEEATRVLIHELLHAACCDPDAPLPIKEANTETWAELMLVAILSKGSEQDGARLWAIQSQWIANQNHLLRSTYSVQSPEDYAWRYTLGREEILASLKMSLPEPSASRTHSSRLTSPAVYP